MVGLRVLLREVERDPEPDEPPCYIGPQREDKMGERKQMTMSIIRIRIRAAAAKL